MRFIPRKSKLKTTIYKNFSIYDALVLLIGLVFFALVIFSNLPIKLGLGIFVAGFFVLLLLGDEDKRTYTEIFYILLFLVRRKKYGYEKKHKKEKLSGAIDELIPFLDIEEDGVVEYGDYVGAVIEVGAVEFGLLDESEQNRRISVVARIFNSLSTTTTIQLVKIDRKIDYKDIAQSLFEKIQRAKNEPKPNNVKIEILQSRLDQIDNLNNFEPLYRPFYYIVAYERNREELSKTCYVIQDSITSAGLKCQILDNTTDVAIFFKYCFSRNFDERDVYNFVGSPSDYVKPKKVKFDVSAIQIDDTFSFTYAISDYPLSVANGWGADLFNIDNTKVVLTIKPCDRLKAVRRLDGVIAELGTRQNSKISTVMADDTHAETLSALMLALQNENESLLDCTITVTGFNNTKEENAVFKKEIKRKVQSLGFKINELYGRQYDGFVTSAITPKNNLKRFERGINSETLGAIFPFVFKSQMDTNGVLLGFDNYPVILDIFKRNDYYNNSNMVVIGKSGAGKSFFTSSLIANLYSDDVQVFIFDPENEYNTLCKNVGGKFIDVGNASKGRINPLQIYQILTDDGTKASPESVYSSHLRFLEDFFKITLPGISADALEELNNLISLLYASVGIEPSTDCSTLKAKDFPTFDNLTDLVQSELKKEQSPIRLNNLARIKTYTEKFAKGGRYAQLWNGPSTLKSEERFVVFNFQSLFENKNTIVSNAQMLVILRYLEQKIINIREINRNSNSVIHPLIAIDEGYNFIDENYPIALDFIRSWFKRIRKYNGSMMFLTQNLSDILGNPEIISKTSAIINNSQYSFIFSLAPQDITALIELYKVSGGINDVERQMIANARRGDCFAILSSIERSTFHVQTSNLITSLFQSSTPSVTPNNEL